LGEFGHHVVGLILGVLLEKLVVGDFSIFVCRV
jgi:hypothetical protein